MPTKPPMHGDVPPRAVIDVGISLADIVRAAELRYREENAEMSRRMEEATKAAEELAGALFADVVDKIHKEGYSCPIVASALMPCEKEVSMLEASKRLVEMFQRQGVDVHHIEVSKGFDGSPVASGCCVFLGADVSPCCYSFACCGLPLIFDWIKGPKVAHRLVLPGASMYVATVCMSASS